jgi:hypothetical protein
MPKDRTWRFDLNEFISWVELYLDARFLTSGARQTKTLLAKAIWRKAIPNL